MTLNNTLVPSAAMANATDAGKLHTTIGAAFFGFVAGAILYGITLRQTYQYFTTTTTVQDKWFRKSIIALVVLLDTLHLVFSMYMVYALILQAIGLERFGGDVLWSLKALGSTQTVFIVFVQGFYLWQIWRFATNTGNILLSRAFKLAVQIFVGFVSFFALGIAVVFMIQLQKLQSILSLSEGFEYVVYLGFGATALVDCAIATAMCLVLYKSSGGTARGESVLDSLIKYFIATGLLTSFAAIMCIVLYVAEPRTLLYLGMEFSVTRLYANSVLAMFNGRQSLRDKMSQPFDIQIPSGLLFGEPDSSRSGSGTRSESGSLMKGFRRLELGSGDYSKLRMGGGGGGGEYAKLRSPEEKYESGGYSPNRYSGNRGSFGRGETRYNGGHSRNGSSYDLSPAGTRSEYERSPGSSRYLNLAHSPSASETGLKFGGDEDDIIGIEVQCADDEMKGGGRGRGFRAPELRSSRNRGSVSPTYSMPASPSSVKSYHT
ncbi:hypothetical protein BJ165DRAFT_1515309 [Panaeolus papilionaceus]|nr:hypothetical protein BJ165DRAFT_1515309 [Panaeolus papilionaceus]